MANAREIQAFLARFRKAMEDRSLAIWPNRKNIGFQIESGFEEDDLALAIKRLKPEDYAWGPRSDDKECREPGEVWCFRKEFEGYVAYIKLKLGKHPYSIPTCMSFHEDGDIDP